MIADIQVYACSVQKAEVCKKLFSFAAKFDIIIYKYLNWKETDNAD